MNAAFADAGYWIALFNPRDQLHSTAVAASRALQGRPIMTSEMVLTEFLNHYAALGKPFRQHAAHVVRSLQENVEIDIVPQAESQFAARGRGASLFRGGNRMASATPSGFGDWGADGPGA